MRKLLVVAIAGLGLAGCAAEKQLPAASVPTGAQTGSMAPVTPPPNSGITVPAGSTIPQSTGGGSSAGIQSGTGGGVTAPGSTLQFNTGGGQMAPVSGGPGLQRGTAGSNPVVVPTKP